MNRLNIEWDRIMQKKFWVQLKDQILNYTKKKSSERLTIMFIPHGDDKIYSFHLSFLMVLFLLVIFLSLILVSLSGYYKYKELSTKIQELKNLYGKNYQNVFNLQNSLVSIQEQIKKHISKNVYNLLQEEFHLKYFMSFEDSFYISKNRLNQEITNNNLVQPNTKYLKATYISNAIRIHLEYKNDLLENITSTFVKKMQLNTDIPNGRPVGKYRFRDTSSYGLRLDPITKSVFEFHTGMDMAGNPNELIYSTADGIVHKVFYDPGYGHTVIIRHPSNYYTLYAHLSKPLVQVNQIIKKGNIIGLMGSSGRVTGTHLHYEVLLPNMDKVNPLPFVCIGDLITERCKNYHKNLNLNESIEESNE